MKYFIGIERESVRFIMLIPNIFQINQYEMTLKLKFVTNYKRCHPERSRRGALGFMLRLRSAGQNGSAFVKICITDNYKIRHAER